MKCFFHNLGQRSVFRRDERLVPMATRGRRAAKGVSTLITVLLCLVTPVGTARFDLPAGIRCADAVRDHWERWQPRDQMRRAAPPALESARFLWSTPRLGVWLDLRVAVDGEAALTRVAADGSTELTWDEACHVTVRDRLSPIDGTGGADSMTDADLEHHAARSRRFVVYLWSPHMPLSVDGLRQVSLASRRLGVELLPVLHPHADHSYAERVAREADLPPGATRRAASVELTFRDLLIHAPSLLLYVDGRPAGLAVPGYRDAAGYERVIREQLATTGRD
jgi:hypothetical protein